MVRYQLQGNSSLWQHTFCRFVQKVYSSHKLQILKIRKKSEVAPVRVSITFELLPQQSIGPAEHV